MASVSAKRHAQAVYEIALEKNELDKWLADLHTISGALKNRQLVEMLENPKVQFAAKTRLIDDTMPGLGRLPRNLVQLLTTKGRLGLVADLAQEYERLVNAHRGIEHAEVTAAVALTDKQRERITGYLSSLSGKKVVVDTKIDPEVIGGLVARIGDMLVDGSVRTQLLHLKKELAEAAS